MPAMIWLRRNWLRLQTLMTERSEKNSLAVQLNVSAAIGSYAMSSTRLAIQQTPSLFL